MVSKQGLVNDENMENITNENEDDNNDSFHDPSNDGLGETDPGEGTVEDSVLDQSSLDQSSMAEAPNDGAFTEAEATTKEATEAEATTAEASEEGAEASDPAFTEQSFPAPPTQGFEDRLVRDPHATFGGVLTGIARRFGWDVSLTRLAYLAAMLLTGGLVVPLYLLAWLVIPRARFWPPAVRPRSRSLSGRDIGVALLGAAILIVLAIGSGDAAAIVVPIALVATGIWLLSQSPRVEGTSAGLDGAVGFGTAQYASAGGRGQAPPRPRWVASQMPSEAPVAAAPRSRSRFGVLVAIVGVVILIPAAIVIGAIVVLANFDNVDFEFGETTRVIPASLETIPTSVNQDEGEYVLDLSDIDFSTADSLDEPIDINISLGAGRITVFVPDGVDVDATAEVAAVGSTRIFEQRESGLSPEQSWISDDPQLILDLELDVGKIEILRAG